MITATCLKTGLDSTITILAGDRQYSILLDGQAQNSGLPSLCECISRSYGQARWLYVESTSSQAWPQIQNLTNGQMGSEQSGSPKNISVSGLALVGTAPRTVSPQFKQGQR